MARIDEDELIEHWTLIGGELAEVAGKRGPTRLAFALLLKFYTRRGRFPRGRGELPDEAVAYVARQVKVPASDLGLYEWSGRTFEYHRAQIRTFLGFRECTVADAGKLTAWLAEHACHRERHPERVREELLGHCRDELIEPPSANRIGRIISSALHQADTALTLRISARIPPAAAARMLALIAEASDDPGGDGDGREAFAFIKSDPGGVSLKTCEEEAAKLALLRHTGLPAGLFAGVAPKVLAAWRARAAMEAPSHLREHQDPVKLTLLAALLYCRRREITDTLADLLITTVHRINARAEIRVVNEFVTELKRVAGKENILFKMTEAALGGPDRLVSEVIYPAVPGGAETLAALLQEYRTGNGLPSAQAAGVQGVLHQSLPQGPDPAAGRAGVRLHQHRARTHDGGPGADQAVQQPGHRQHPVLRPRRAGPRRWRRPGRPAGADVPRRQARQMRILRSVYECGVFQTLREQLRCKEIWVAGADKWRNPDEDLPADFEANRAENYHKLRKPLDARKFTSELREEMDAELTALNDALPHLDWLEIKERRAGGAIILTPLAAAPEPVNLRRLKAAVKDRWGVVPLLDMLTETALRTGCLNAFTPLGSRENIDPAVLFERLLLLIYAYGTNTGIRAVAAGDHPHSEDDLRYIRRRYVTIQACRDAARAIANATFAARHAWLWGQGTTAVASDSTHFSAFDQNIFTEWHSRYRRAKRGVLIYWTVDTAGAMAIHSQLLQCSASEVHAMVEGAMRHGTDMSVESNYVDSHGASFIGFGITRLLDFDLIARFKQINQMKLYLPGKGDTGAYPLLQPALTRPVRWDIIEPQYDSMIKYATAIRLGTASTEAILRRFTKDVTHPAYAAMLETGRAQRTIFLARWLRDRDLQRETSSGLNVVENYNGVNDYIHFGKRGELASNRREEQELSMLCLHILQSSLAFINTLMIQDTLAEPEWAGVLGDADRRGLTPLFHANMTPYGEVQLRMDRRLHLTAAPQADAAGEARQASGSPA